MMNRVTHCNLFLVLLFAAIAGCAGPEDPMAGPGRPNGPGGKRASAPSLTLGGETYRVTGPEVHGNTAIYLLHSDKQDPRVFLTLDQALKSRQVRILEKGQGEVGELVLTNQSDQPVFLQEGDRLQGGKQDRTMFTTLIIPPGATDMPLPAFCIEPNRWVAGGGGNEFAASASPALAPKSVRMAAKYDKDQGKVWENVAAEKQAAGRAFALRDRTTSLNEAQDSRAVRQRAENVSGPLTAALKREPTAVGMAIAVGGKIEELDVYPNHDLLARIGPRLVQSYAIQAAQSPKGGARVRPPAVADVVRFAADGKESARRSESAPGGNGLVVRELGGKREAVSTFEGGTVHRQLMSK